MARGRGRRPRTTQELMNEYWERKEGGTGWVEQDVSEDTHTNVKAGESYDLGVPTTEFVIADRDHSGHQHIVLDNYGNEIVNHRSDGR